MAQNGLQALHLIEHVRPNLILLDIMMPEMDGFETCRRLKASADTRDIPVIFLTAKADMIEEPYDAYFRVFATAFAVQVRQFERRTEEVDLCHI